MGGKGQVRSNTTSHYLSEQLQLVFKMTFYFICLAQSIKIQLKQTDDKQSGRFVVCYKTLAASIVRHCDLLHVVQ